MVVTRVLVVSDTHLSARTPEALANWDAVLRYANERRPALVVHVGDISADGASHAEDLELARHEIDRLEAPVRLVPGNHDVGDNDNVGPARLDRYLGTFGPDRWRMDLPGWQLLGLDAQLFDSGLDAEDSQWDWLTCSLAEWAELPTPPRLGLVLHKPLRPTPLVTDDAGPRRYVPPVARRRLRDLLRGAEGSVLLSGHCHQFAHHSADDLTFVWIPSTWAVIPDSHQPRLGDKACGIVELRLADDGDLRIQLIQPAGLSHHVLGETAADPYEITL